MTPETVVGWLLDTHTLIWSLYRDPRLSEKAVELIDGSRPIYFSTVTFWEIALKRSTRDFDVEISEDWHVEIPAELRRIGVIRLDTAPGDCRAMELLPRHHGDPFDRMLIAQAAERRLGLISKDEIFDDYGAIRAW